MKDKLFIIKGTGLALDGSVVVVKGSVQFPNGMDGKGDEFMLVAPPNSPSDTQNTMVKKACLQPLANKANLVYTIEIHRKKGGVTESTEIQIPNCPREVSVDTIAEYLETNLVPILRME